MSVAHSPCYVYGAHSTVGRSVVSIYDLGGILTSGCIHIPAIDLTTVLYAILVWQLHNQMKHCVDLLYNNIRTWEVNGYVLDTLICKQNERVKVVTVGVSVWVQWVCQYSYSGHVNAAAE